MKWLFAPGCALALTRPELAERLQLAHLRAVVLLGECARINRLLLESLFPASRTPATYSQGGAEPWGSGPGLLDAEL